MKVIFGNLKPYILNVIIIFIFLVVQAWCDLSLPAYTSDIIDVGIQGKGVEYIFPEKITKEEFELSKNCMTESEKNIWENIYNEDGDYMQLKALKKKEMKSYENDMTVAIMINSQMRSMAADSLKEYMYQAFGEAMNIDKEMFMALSISDISKMSGMEIETFTAVKENAAGEFVETECVDMRKFMSGSAASQVDEMRKGMEPMIESIGTSMIRQVGVSYAAEMDAAAGIDLSDLQTSYLIKSGLKMLAVALLMAAVAVIIGFFGARTGAGVGRDLREKLFAKVIGFSNDEINNFQTASLITRTTNDVQQIQMVTTVLLRMVFYAPIIGIGGVIKVASTGANMGWVIFAAVAIILAFVLVLMAVALPKFKLMQILVDKVNLVSREILTGISVIRSFGREKEEEKRFDDANTELTKTHLFTNRIMTFMMPGMMMIMYGLTLTIVWVAAHRIDSGVMQVGQMTAFITYAMQIVMSFLMLTAMSIMLPRAGVAADRIKEVLDTEFVIKDAETEKKIAEEKGSIEFKNVAFKYSGASEAAIKGINFTAEPGQTTAIIGSTGCGKSTLINLIPRLYDVTDGEILLDGVNVKELKLNYLRERIGFVPQKGVLFSGTIKSNIKFANENISDEMMTEAATIAQAKDFILEKEDGFDSHIAQGGSNVSGGQKQRIAIARAIAKNPDIFIFDDSFSALDLKTDAKLRKELFEKTKDKTVIIVAQRVSTIINADKIIVMSDGEICGIGKHEELLKNCDEYLQIAKSQLSEKELGLSQ